MAVELHATVGVLEVGVLGEEGVPVEDAAELLRVQGDLLLLAGVVEVVAVPDTVAAVPSHVQVTTQRGRGNQETLQS